jgi:hypothetical protein
MKLTITQTEVLEMVAKHLAVYGLDVQPADLKVEFQHQGEFDDREVVGFEIHAPFSGSLLGVRPS